MSGSPLRPDRASFGPTLEETAPVRDARRQFSAAFMNLVLWQVSGLGLVMPRAVLYFAGSATPTILGRVEAWNPNRETSGQYADPEITVTGAGNYLIEYPTPVLDEAGVEQAVSFSWALAFVHNADPTVLKHSQAAVIVANTNQIRACAFSNANALEHGNNLVVCGW